LDTAALSLYLCETQNKEMAIKKTIAIVGATAELGRAIVNRFAFRPYRLLLVSDKLVELKEFSAKLMQQQIEAEIEPLECVKDSCWEADLIVLSVAPAEEEKVAELMKEVATQKIVVIVSENKNECKELENVLPYSKIVKAFINTDANTVLLNGKSETVNEEILSIFKQAGYRTALNTVNYNF
jgi:predicted dinucleotide-binding enzyme